jgi:hypothetical protein
MPANQIINPLFYKDFYSFRESIGKYPVPDWEINSRKGSDPRRRVSTGSGGKISGGASDLLY